MSKCGMIGCRTLFALSRQAAVVGASLLLVASGVRGADQAPDPEIERKSFQVAEGFEVTLFAADPMFAKPIGMNFDAQGRLWVASSAIYPQVKPGEIPNDKIYVLEDTDGDGKADKSTVFAEGLHIPTSVIPGDGGAYVTNAVEILHIPDANNDLKPDGPPRVVLSGFGTEDTHHIIHSLHWGPDGRLYFNQSVYIHSHVETPWGVRHLNGTGIWRFQPETAKLDVFGKGMWNPWGFAWTTTGQSFATDGAGGEGIHHAFPGHAFDTATEIERKIHGFNPGSPKYCGLDVVNGRHLPDDWQGSLLTADFRANRVVRFELKDDNGVLSSKLMPDVIRSTDSAFRPVDIKMGPDGAIYIADWYNPIINHGEVDFRDPRRDKTHGRIWKLTAKGRPLVKPPVLVGVPVEKVLEQLKAPELWTRQQAKIVLRSLGAKDVVPALAKWVAGIDAADSQAEQLRLEALWVYESFDIAEPQLLATVLASKNGSIRAGAARTVPDFASRIPNAIDLLTPLVTDDNALARLEAVRALAYIPQARSVEVATLALDKPKTPELDFAIWLTTKELQPVWMPAFQAGKLRFGGNQSALNYVLGVSNSPAALKALVDQFKAGQLSADSRAGVVEMIADVGSEGDLKVLFDVAMQPTQEPKVRAIALASLERAVRRRKALPQGHNREELKPLLAEKDEAVRIAAIKLVGAYKLAALRSDVAALATSADTTPPVAMAATAALAEIGGPESAVVLQSLDAAPKSYSLRVAAVGALAEIDLADASTRAAALLSAAPADADPGELLAPFLQREGGGEKLAAAMAAGKPMSADSAKLSLRFVNTTGRDDPALTAQLRKAAGLGETPAPATPEQVASVVKGAQEKGNAARGELIFRRSDMGCFQCHALAGAGGNLAPDLRAIGASSPPDYIVESILLPSKSVKEGFESLVVATAEGEVFSGIKVSHDDKQLVLRDATHDRIAIPVASIKRQKDGGSLMPPGLADALTRAELVDLVRFLMELGKPGPYGADNVVAVRRWLVPSAATAQRLNDDAKLLASPASLDMDWTPVYSMASGTLPAAALGSGTAGSAFVRADINVASAGLIGLHIPVPQGLSLWVDGTAVAVKEDLQIELPKGSHVLVMKVDAPAQRTAGLRVEIRDVAGSAATALPVVGK